MDFLGFLTLGLLGSVGHCVGMCAPFVLFVSRRYAGGAGRARALAVQGWYTAGRVVTYSLLGALAGALGAAVQTAGALVGLRRGALLLAGLVLVVWALVALADAGTWRPALAGRVGTWRPALAGRSGSRDPSSAGFNTATLFARLSALLKGRAPGHPFAAGLFLGLLPCGFLYSAVIGAVALGDALRGASALALFGLGTAPALLGLSLADELLARNRVLLNRLAQVFILVMGARFLWRGLAG
jgi:sulfite exporter TauE/SafE